VLGLGDIGPLAAKPVMEGKGVLFKKFAGIDVFDIEVNEKNLDKLIDVIAALEPTFGGINLEDIKAPDCFYVERALRSRMKIPVFHDDQHGTAIVVGAGVLNALKVSGKKIDEVKLVTSGAGAAALACLGLLVKLGVPRENIWVTDLAGVVYEGRVELMDEDKVGYAQKTEQRTLAEVIKGADIFLGLSAAACSSPRWWRRCAPTRSSSPSPTRRRRSCPRKCTRCAATRSSPPAAPTTRTRSTTSSASRTSSAARSTRARPRSRSRWRSPRCTRSPGWRRPSRARS
jgi:malate dehydrogenase (oxaloacetate-decarboxylating)(NADP+)